MDPWCGGTTPAGWSHVASVHCGSARAAREHAGLAVGGTGSRAGRAANLGNAQRLGLPHSPTCSTCKGVESGEKEHTVTTGARRGIPGSSHWSRALARRVAVPGLTPLPAAARSRWGRQARSAPPAKQHQPVHTHAFLLARGQASARLKHQASTWQSALEQMCVPADSCRGPRVSPTRRGTAPAGPAVCAVGEGLAAGAWAAQQGARCCFHRTRVVPLRPKYLLVCCSAGRGRGCCTPVAKRQRRRCHPAGLLAARYGRGLERGGALHPAALAGGCEPNCCRRGGAPARQRRQGDARELARRRRDKHHHHSERGRAEVSANPRQRPRNSGEERVAMCPSCDRPAPQLHAEPRPTPGPPMSGLFRRRRTWASCASGSRRASSGSSGT